MIELFFLAVQTASGLATLEPVIVTGASRPGPVLSQPFAVGVLDADALLRSGPGVQASEALTRVPGLWAADRGNAAQDVQLSIRGFGARTSFGVRGVRLWVDGLPASATDGSGALTNFPLAQAQQIEVLRGPFSALYGVNSGGVIALRTRAPETGPLRLSGSVWLANEGQQQVQAQVEGGDNASGPWRLAASHWRTDGQRPQAQAQRTLLDARWDPSPGWSLRANALSQPAQDPLGLTRAQWVADPDSTAPQASQFDTRKRLQQQQLGVAADVDGWSFRSWAQQRQVVQWQAIPTATQTPVSSPGGVIDLDRTQLGADLRRRMGPVVLGAQLEQQSEVRRGFENFVGAPPAQQLGVTGALRRDERNRARSAELYAQAELPMTDTLTLYPGLRVGELNLRSQDRYITTDPRNGDDSGATRLHHALPVIGLGLQLAERTRAFASLGQARETPTLNELAYRPDGAAGLNTALRPQRSTQGEMGLKHRADWGSVELVAFAAATQDEIVSARNSGGRAAFTNAARTRRQGVELQVQWRPAPGWQWDAAATALSARVRTPYAVCVAAPCTTATLSVPAGAQLPGVPAQQARLDAAWQVSERWQLGATASARSRLWVDERNTDAAPGHGLLAAWARWQISAQHQLLLRADNLLDRQHIASVIANEANGRYFEPGPGRSVSLQWRYTPD